MAFDFNRGGQVPIKLEGGGSYRIGGASLTSLPREVRSMIFKDLLIEKKKIDIAYFSTSAQDDTLRKMAVRVPHNRHRYHPGQVWVAGQKRWLRVRSTMPALLLVNKALSAEVSEMLYSKGTFSFDEMSTMLIFLRRICGRNVRHLRHVEIKHEGFQLKYVCEVFAQLGMAKNLRRLSIPYDGIDRFDFTHKQFFRICENLILGLYYSRMYRGMKAQSLLNVVQIVPDPTRFVNKSDLAHFQSRLKERIAQRLGIRL